MKTKQTVFYAIIILAFLSQPLAAQITTPPNGANQKSKVSQWMGPVEVSITYNSPDVTDPNGQSRKGQIWGQLVPYGLNNLGFGTSTAAPWRAGANENTIFHTTHDIEVEGKKLPAGTYGLHVIVEENDPWTVIFSKDTQAWGSFFYDESKDALRVKASPVKSEFTEWLTFGFDDRQLGSSTAYLQWEEQKLPFKLAVPDVNDIYLATIREELTSSKGFQRQSWTRAANFCLQNNTNLEEALTWADAAISGPFVGQKNFTTLQTKSRVLTALGKDAEAKTVIDEALNHPTASMNQIHGYARGLVGVGKNQEALNIFKLNRKKNPKDKFTTYVGLARGYTAVGKKKEALKNWEVALKNIPDNQKAFLPQYQQIVQQLKDSM